MTYLWIGAVEDLMKYLDPQFTDHMAVPDSMKLEFILAGEKCNNTDAELCWLRYVGYFNYDVDVTVPSEEDFLLSQAAMLEQASNLQPLLESTYIRG